MVVKVENIGKIYGKNTILESVSLEINRGKVFSLCGESGSGKTTLIRIISGLLGFDKGKLTINNNIINHDSVYPKRLYGQIGVVFQEHNLFPHLTAAQNIMLALTTVKKMTKKQAGTRALQELEKVGLVKRANSYPSTLSGGERQRVAISRSLAMDPSILILDEPTSGLDPSKISEILKIIKKVSSGGMTLLLVTHNIPFAKQIGDSFGILKKGKLTTTGDRTLLDEMLNLEYSS
jgi:polar amino acid transport system ATP-binding protein